MNVLILGGGGREHAIAWKVAKSSLLNRLYIAPGNAGTKTLGQNIKLSVTDFVSIKNFVIDHQIDLVIVGPEAPLVKGIHDFFAADESLDHVKIIGPKSNGAMLEGSKDFAKRFMQRNNIPTARFHSFDKSELKQALEHIEAHNPPYVIKANGLAAGKGVLIETSKESAKEALEKVLKDGKFGAAGDRVIIEEFLDGIEVSAFVLTDGRSYKMLPLAKDYKRIGEGDTGLNTGGMGAVSPVPFVDQDFLDKVEHRIIIPTLKGLKEEDITYKGVLFIGLMKVNEDPYVIEYNVRFGDPEAEAILPRIKTDLLSMFESLSIGTLSECDLLVDERTCATVVLTSGGYPEAYEKGFEINGSMPQRENVLVFHAGTREDENRVVTDGGRVLAVSALDKDLQKAISTGVEMAKAIQFKGKYFRSDIGEDLLNLEKA